MTNDALISITAKLPLITASDVVFLPSTFLYNIAAPIIAPNTTTLLPRATMFVPSMPFPPPNMIYFIIIVVTSNVNVKAIVDTHINLMFNAAFVIPTEFLWFPIFLNKAVEAFMIRNVAAVPTIAGIANIDIRAIDAENIKTDSPISFKLDAASSTTSVTVSFPILLNNQSDSLISTYAPAAPIIAGIASTVIKAIEAANFKTDSDISLRLVAPSSTLSRFSVADNGLTASNISLISFFESFAPIIAGIAIGVTTLIVAAMSTISSEINESCFAFAI